VLVTKNPCLHPGDIRKLKAVSVPELESCMRDCIVFSVDGSRPNCNEMAGSDLDGDQYWVYWGDEFQIETVVEPLLYPPTKKTCVNRVTNELIVNHVLDTFIDKVPGIIANTHKAIADKHPLGTHSNECRECALLFARAIDSRKTGEIISRDCVRSLKDKYCQTYPSWMLKFDKPEMDPPSQSINEILYRKAKDAWIDQDNYQDILRPLPGVEILGDTTVIDIDDTELVLEQDQAEERSGHCSKICCLCIMIIIVLIATFLLASKRIFH
jgi:RNA-dependent RNA polymerase